MAKLNFEPAIGDRNRGAATSPPRLRELEGTPQNGVHDRSARRHGVSVPLRSILLVAPLANRSTLGGMDLAKCQTGFPRPGFQRFFVCHFVGRRNSEAIKVREVCRRTSSLSVSQTTPVATTACMNAPCIREQLSEETYPSRITGSQAAQMWLAPLKKPGGTEPLRQRERPLAEAETRRGTAGRSVSLLRPRSQP